MNLFSGAVRLVLGVILALVALPACFHVLVTVVQGLYGSPGHPWALIAGVASAAALVWWRKPNWLIHTLIHEACHAIVAALFGVKVKAFQATDGQGGAVIHAKVDPVRTTIIALAPYTVPLLLGPVLIGRALVTAPSTAAVVLTFLCGFLAVHHLHGLYHNVRINFWGKQADLTRAGKVLSLVVIVGVHALLAAAWLEVLWEG
ncbi:MAG: M50 family metallopeptidase [Planctomycetota bacterium]|nr:M50 family metallopeptidase [Planctomycetota bacterium]